MIKVTAISDTHSQHYNLILDKTDLLIHCGDFSRRGTVAETMEFLDWYETQPAKEKVLVCGNHDFFGEEFPHLMRESCQTRGIRFLNHEPAEVLGLSIFGSPYTPVFGRWAFMKERGPELRRLWSTVPSGLDILVTHGPPYMILDNALPYHVGDADLLNAVEELKPSFHVFGHIHEQGGETLTIGETTFINASTANRFYQMANKPMQFAIYDPHEEVIR